MLESPPSVTLLITVIATLLCACGVGQLSITQGDDDPEGDDTAATNPGGDDPPPGDDPGDGALPGDDDPPPADPGPGDAAPGDPGPPVCSPESDAEFCTRLPIDCGSVTDLDNCGGTRTVVCGTCSNPLTCGGGGTVNVCGCPQESDADICGRLGLNCDTTPTVDACGINRMVGCGTCTAPESCGGGGTANTCGCTPEDDAAFCAAAGASCGPVTAPDNCGAARTVDCGSCTLPDTCGGGGVTGACGCSPETDADFCTRLGKDCETVVDDNNCGVQRTVDCGACQADEVCGGINEPPNVCNLCGADGDPCCICAGGFCCDAVICAPDFCCVSPLCPGSSYCCGAPLQCSTLAANIFHCAPCGAKGQQSCVIYNPNGSITRECDPGLTLIGGGLCDDCGWLPSGGQQPWEGGPCCGDSCYGSGTCMGPGTGQCVDFDGDCSGTGFGTNGQPCYGGWICCRGLTCGSGSPRRCAP